MATKRPQRSPNHAQFAADNASPATAAAIAGKRQIGASTRGCPVEEHLASGGRASSSRPRSSTRARSSAQRGFMRLGRAKPRAAAGTPSSDGGSSPPSGAAGAGAALSPASDASASASVSLSSPASGAPCAQAHAAGDPAPAGAAAVTATAPPPARGAAGGGRRGAAARPVWGAAAEDAAWAMGGDSGARRGGKRTKWSAADDQLLRTTVTERGAKNWKEIAKVFGGRRSDVQCMHRWNKVLKPGLHKGPWSEEEDRVVYNEVTRRGVANVKWSHIASLLHGRIGKQCRERWFNHLDPTISRAAWTPEEDLLILHAQGEVGNKWCEIAKLLPGRTENAVKNRWNSAMHRRLQQAHRRDGDGGRRAAKRGVTLDSLPADARRRLQDMAARLPAHPPSAPLEHTTPRPPPPAPAPVPAPLPPPVPTASAIVVAPGPAPVSAPGPASGPAPEPIPASAPAPTSASVSASASASATARAPAVGLAPPATHAPAHLQAPLPVPMPAPAHGYGHRHSHPAPSTATLAALTDTGPPPLPSPGRRGPAPQWPTGDVAGRGAEAETPPAGSDASMDPLEALREHGTADCVRGLRLLAARSLLYAEDVRPRGPAHPSPVHAEAVSGHRLLSALGRCVAVAEAYARGGASAALLAAHAAATTAVAEAGAAGAAAAGPVPPGLPPSAAAALDRCIREAPAAVGRAEVRVEAGASAGSVPLADLRFVLPALEGRLRDVLRRVGSRGRGGRDGGGGRTVKQEPRGAWLGPGAGLPGASALSRPRGTRVEGGADTRDGADDDGEEEDDEEGIGGGVIAAGAVSLGGGGAPALDRGRPLRDASAMRGASGFPPPPQGPVLDFVARAEDAEDAADAHLYGPLSSLQLGDDDAVHGADAGFPVDPGQGAGGRSAPTRRLRTQTRRSGGGRGEGGGGSSGLTPAFGSFGRLDAGLPPRPSEAAEALAPSASIDSGDGRFPQVGAAAFAQHPHAPLSVGSGSGRHRDRPAMLRVDSESLDGSSAGLPSPGADGFPAFLDASPHRRGRAGGLLGRAVGADARPGPQASAGAAGLADDKAGLPAPSPTGSVLSLTVDDRAGVSGLATASDRKWAGTADGGPAPSTNLSIESFGFSLEDV